MVSSEVRTPLVLEIKGNSLDDGPGIRSVVFFKGCPLACSWCHNPESQSKNIEISYDSAECIACDSCIKVCTRDALDRSRRYNVDRERCNLCFDCVAACPTSALSKVGYNLSIQEIVEIISLDKPFFDSSGGGLTVSGGEPTLYMDFTSELLRTAREAGIHTLIETCGFFNGELFLNKIVPYVDQIFYDIKIFDAADHRYHCRTANDSILSNFKLILESVGAQSGKILPRIPLIPDITDTDHNLSQIADLLKSEGANQVSLLSYNPLWFDKCSKIGIANELAEDPRKRTWQSQEKIALCRAIFAQRGIEVV